jgi:hypothetical protein
MRSGLVRSRVPDALQRLQRCGAEPGPTRHGWSLKHRPRLCGAPLKKRCHSASKTRVTALMASGARELPSSTKHQTQPRILAADLARAMLSASHPFGRKGAGKTGRRLAPMARCAEKTRTQSTATTQVKPETTRPSLRSGLTAYARSPRRRVPVCLRHVRGLTMHRCPVGSLHLRRA